MTSLKRSFVLFILLCAYILITPPQLFAQDLGETLETVGEDYARLYVTPLVNAFGADINAGMFHTAKIGGTGILPAIDIYVGVKVFGAQLSDDDKTLSLNYVAEQDFQGPDGNTYRLPVNYQINNAPTVFGETNAGVVTATVNETVHPGADGVSGTGDDIVINETSRLDLLAGLVDTDIAPLAIPQIGIGTLFGTDVILRYLPAVEVEDYGSAEFLGYGLRHSLSQYIPLLPVDIAIGAMWQEMQIDDTNDNQVFKSSSFAGFLSASKSFGPATFYLGAQTESTTVDIAYSFEDDRGNRTDVAFELDAPNEMRILGGLSLGIGPIVLNVDYSASEYNTISAGVGLAL